MNELRFNADELRLIGGDEKQLPKIVGYAAVWNSMSEDLGGFREKIMPGAFADALRSSGDIIALVHHDPSMVLGRRSKGTLQLKEDERGLQVEITPPNTNVGRDAVENIRRGDVAGMSFRMNRVKDSWGKEGGGAVRTLHSVGLLREVTLTSMPAYSDTMATLRSADTAEATEYAKKKLAELEARPNAEAVDKRLAEVRI